MASTYIRSSCPDVDDPHIRQHADHAEDAEDHHGEHPERVAEVGGLTDERDAEQTRRGQRQEHADAGEHLALRRAPRCEQAPVLGRQQLRANRGRCGRNSFGRQSRLLRHAAIVLPGDRDCERPSAPAPSVPAPSAQRTDHGHGVPHVLHPLLVAGSDDDQQDPADAEPEPPRGRVIERRQPRPELRQAVQQHHDPAEHERRLQTGDEADEQHRDPDDAEPDNAPQRGIAVVGQQ